MIQGTGSDVGKSLIVAGLCRSLARRGVCVAPFKPQNMSNNAGVASTPCGGYGEIGRAQMLQAFASGIAPSVHMNPVLLKPQSHMGSQVILHGKVWGHASASYFRDLKPTLLSAVVDSYTHLCHTYDYVVVEGAGSPAEVNLRDGDIANMGFAEAVDIPVVLVADIDRGGSLAQVVGTHAVLPENERSRIKGYIINKFRGDSALYEDALNIIHAHTGWDCLGVVPWFKDAAMLPAEDSMSVQNIASKITTDTPFKICVPRLPRIANFDDIAPLQHTPNVQVNIINAPENIAMDTDLVLLVGSKSTISDMAYMRSVGWDTQMKTHAKNGGWVMGICGGYQMLGTTISDTAYQDGTQAYTHGLNLLNMNTVMQSEKTVKPVHATCAITRTDFTGYEIHMGQSEHRHTPFSTYKNGVADGAVNGRILGTYIHGLFHTDSLRQALLTHMGWHGHHFDYTAQLQNTLDRLADHLEHYIDMEKCL